MIFILYKRQHETFGSIGPEAGGQTELTADWTEGGGALTGGGEEGGVLL